MELMVIIQYSILNKMSYGNKLSAYIIIVRDYESVDGICWYYYMLYNLNFLNIIL